MATLPKMSQAGNTYFSVTVVITIWLSKWTHKFLIIDNYTLKWKSLMWLTLHLLGASQLLPQTEQKSRILTKDPVKLCTFSDSSDLSFSHKKLILQHYLSVRIFQIKKKTKWVSVPSNTVFNLQEVTVPKKNPRSSWNARTHVRLLWFVKNGCHAASCACGYTAHFLLPPAQSGAGWWACPTLALQELLWVILQYSRLTWPRGIQLPLMKGWTAPGTSIISESPF